MALHVIFSKAFEKFCCGKRLTWLGHRISRLNVEKLESFVSIHKKTDTKQISVGAKILSDITNTQRQRAEEKIESGRKDTITADKRSKT